jgi:hypothetical protein
MPAEVNLDWYLSVCQKLFNNLTTARPNVEAVNSNFGSAHSLSLSLCVCVMYVSVLHVVLFVNNALLLWRAQWWSTVGLQHGLCSVGQRPVLHART